MFPQCSLWKKNTALLFVSVVLLVGAKMEVFVLAGKGRGAQARLELTAGPVRLGPDQAGLQLMLTEIL